MAPPRPTLDSCDADHRSSNAPVVWPVICVVVLLAVAGPQFIRTPLTNDTALFDLQAVMIRDGAVLYRDVLEPNLPGVIWIHTGVRTIFGESSEAMRIFDLAVFCAILAAGGCWLVGRGFSRATSGWFCVAGLAFYFSISEWCHCQRDTWMLLPAMVGLLLRGLRARRWMQSEEQPAGVRNVYASGVVEGVCWAAGVWIKPYVAIPAAAAWCVSHLFVRRKREFLADTAGLLTGGLLVGGVGVLWMIRTGCWPAFLESAREWNPRYFEAGREHWTKRRFITMCVRLWPWSFLHVFAVPTAIVTLLRYLRSRTENATFATRSLFAALLCVFYLGWVAQAFFLQHLFDYVHAPAILLSVLLLVAAIAGTKRRMLRVGGIGVFALLAAAASPIFSTARLGLWQECLAGPASPRLQNRLTHFSNPDREDMQRVAEFLRREGVADRDVCLFNSDFVSMYQMLNLRPPTKFIYLYESATFFPDRSAELERALDESGHRYVVTDLVSCGMPQAEAEAIGPNGPLAPPPAYPTDRDNSYPWSHPVVYRSGTYLVHRVDGSAGRLLAGPLRTK